MPGRGHGRLRRQAGAAGRPCRRRSRDRCRACRRRRARSATRRDATRRSPRDRVLDGARGRAAAMNLDLRQAHVSGSSTVRSRSTPSFPALRRADVAAGGAVARRDLAWGWASASFTHRTISVRTAAYALMIGASVGGVFTIAHWILYVLAHRARRPPPCPISPRRMAPDVSSAFQAAVRRLGPLLWLAFPHRHPRAWRAIPACLRATGDPDRPRGRTERLRRASAGTCPAAFLRHQRRRADPLLRRRARPRPVGVRRCVRGSRPGHHARRSTAERCHRRCDRFTGPARPRLPDDDLRLRRRPGGDGPADAVVVAVLVGTGGAASG